MRKYIFIFVALANLLNAGESGVFIGGSLSLNNTSYSGAYSTLENNITTNYPHSNYSHNAFGASARIGYQKFSTDARFGGRFYLEYDIMAMQHTEMKMAQSVKWTLIVLL